MGTPMGEQGSCAKANGVCMDDELAIDATHADSERNLSLAFVDEFGLVASLHVSGRHH